MNFTFTWIMDKLGFVPKFNIQIKKPAQYSFQEEKKTAVRKTAAKKTVAKKATKVSKKAT